MPDRAPYGNLGSVFDACIPDDESSKVPNTTKLDPIARLYARVDRISNPHIKTAAEVITDIGLVGTAFVIEAAGDLQDRFMHRNQSKE
jgi:hypothetical protein